MQIFDEGWLLKKISLLIKEINNFSPTPARLLSFFSKKILPVPFLLYSFIFWMGEGTNYNSMPWQLIRTLNGIRSQQSVYITALSKLMLYSSQRFGKPIKLSTGYVHSLKCVWWTRWFQVYLLSLKTSINCCFLYLTIDLWINAVSMQCHNLHSLTSLK